MSEYPEYEYNDTQNACEALIRAQGEQIRETPEEYIARKYGIRGDKLGAERTLREDT